MGLPSSRDGTPVWVDLSVPDVEAAGRFYERVLGWTLTPEDSPMGLYVVASVPAGPVGGMMAPPPDEADAPPAWTVMFGVRDVDEWLATATGAGASVVQPTTEIPGGDTIAAVTDPAGATLAVMHLSHGEAIVQDELGAVAWVETQTRRLDASRDFYTTVFDWTVHEWAVRQRDVDYWTFERQGRSVAGLMAMPADVPPEVPSYWLTYFAVDDAPAACDRAVAEGGSVVVPAMRVAETRFAVLGDAQGATFAVLETVATTPDDEHRVLETAQRSSG